MSSDDKIHWPLFICHVANSVRYPLSLFQHQSIRRDFDVEDASDDNYCGTCSLCKSELPAMAQQAQKGDGLLVSTMPSSIWAQKHVGKQKDDVCVGVCVYVFGVLAWCLVTHPISKENASLLDRGALWEGRHRGGNLTPIMSHISGLFLCL